MRLYFMVTVLAITTQAQTQRSKDDAVKDIFGNSEYIPPNHEEVSTPAPAPLTALPKCGEGPDLGKKVCIEYHRCDGETNTVTYEENTSGEGLIDIREGANECENYMDVCCKLPETNPLSTTTTTTKSPVPEPPVIRPSKCGIRNTRGLDFQIIGNTNEAEYGEFPWMVVILKTNYVPKEDESQFICGGALIGPAVVLTGAHCVTNYTDSLHELKIRAGEWDTLTEKERLPYQERAIRQVVMHKKFNPKSLFNDVALVLLERSFVRADNIGTICLPPQDLVFDTRDCFASGWGKTAFGKSGRYSAILKKIQLPIIPREQCQTSLRQTRLGKRFILDQSFICAGGESGTDTCTGDGGSPLVCPDPNSPGRYLQAGIVAWGIGCGEKDIPGVYANVAYFRNWVDQEIERLGLRKDSYII